MPMSIQAKILRLLQERSIERIGGREPIPVDVRIIAATNRDLEASLNEGRFREDLYYRLKVVTIELPSLRERKGDVALLTEYFLEYFSREMGQDNPGISPEAMASLEGHTWHGNVRELANTIQKALIFNRGNPIRDDEISRAIKGDIAAKASGDEDDINTAVRTWIRQALVSGNLDNVFNFLTDQFSSIIISEALTITGGNRSRAASLLGLTRPTLQSKIEKYRLKVGVSVKSE